MSTTPIHIPRNTNAVRRKRPVGVASTVYEAGHFLALVRKYDWPPQFEPQINAMKPHEFAFVVAARLGREMAAQTGAGWGAGTLVMPNTPKNVRPGMMRK